MRRAIAAGALLTACAGPVGPFPGGALRGEAAAPPADWSFLERASPCALELRPADPHSVRLTCFATDGRLYVACVQGAARRWARMLGDDPRVRVRVGGKVYSLVAVRLTEAEERRGILSEDGDVPSESTWIWRLD